MLIKELKADEDGHDGDQDTSGGGTLAERTEQTDLKVLLILERLRVCTSSSTK